MKILKTYLRVCLVLLPLSFLPIIIDAFGLGKNWLMLGFRTLRDLGTLGIAIYYLNEYNGVKGAYYLTLSSLLMSVVFLVTMALFYHLKLNSTGKSDYEYIEDSIVD